MRVHVDRVERGRAADIEAIALGAAKADVGDDFGDLDLADQRAVGRVDVDAVAGRGPDVAFRIDAKAVEQADRAGREQFRWTERAPIGGDFGDANVLWAILDMGRAGVGDIELFLVGEKARPFGLTKSVATAVDLATRGIEAIDVARADLGRRGVALIIRNRCRRSDR